MKDSLLPTRCALRMDPSLIHPAPPELGSSNDTQTSRLRQPDPTGRHRPPFRGALTPSAGLPSLERVSFVNNGHLLGVVGNHTSLTHPFHGGKIDDRPHNIQAVTVTQLQARSTPTTSSSSDTNTVPFRQSSAPSLNP